jgi:hypothetical protein
MFVRPCSFLLVASMGCAPTGPPLSRLVQAWAADTAEQASAPMTGTLVLAAFAGELCFASATGSWDNLEPSDALPISRLLGDALGNPTIHSADYGDAGVAQMLLADVDIAGRTGQWLRVTINAQEDTFSVEFAPLVADEEVVTETARLDGFGQINLSVDSSCTAERSMVGGNALWIDHENRRHEVKMPADQELGSDMVFGDDVPWIPVSGGISWEARIDKQRRTITTEDADEIRVNESLVSRWPVVVHGPDWSGNVLTTIAP